MCKNKFGAGSRMALSSAALRHDLILHSGGLGCQISLSSVPAMQAALLRHGTGGTGGYNA
jgi:hypothetical protein